MFEIRLGRSFLITVFAAVSMTLGVLSAGAKTLVFPHLLEQSGGIIDTQNTFDTQFFMTYSAGLAGTPGGSGTATVDLYVFDETTGLPLQSGTRTDVCNPCTYPLGTGGPGLAPRERRIVLDDEIVSQGGFPATAVIQGFAVAVVSGDVDNVTLSSEVVCAKSGPNDLCGWVIDPQSPGGPGCPSSGSARTFVVPHVLETAGTINDTQNTFDTQLFMTYSSGIADIPAGTGAHVEVYLFDETTGNLMVSGTGQPVCAPCSFPMGTEAQGTPAPRKRSIRVENLIQASGGFPPTAGPVLGFAVIVINGDDPGGVNLTSSVVNAKTSPFDLSVFVFEPQVIEATAATSVEDDVRGAVGALHAAPNPSSGTLRLAFSMASATDVTLEVFDPQGRRVATVFRGHREAGDHAIAWDRRDDDGRPVEAGIYFGRLSGGDGSRMTRIVYMPR